ncbi:MULTISPECIES: 4-hydroxy-tetrahydrodipicolinate reductase [Acetobacteraceae]|uniref:4-hydroxy-tetrahydrodipicolinate reductase n=1 Tax=Acetobacteraceae TaxID=433 RepID=UPI00200BD2CD|nr:MULTISPECIES: 4-hydroxy-tetrahydrodipicolinate reductase [Acetobacteraceae]MCK8637743.1 4-hydroxy-tetrahydrodipicolinate reductase [Parasaccharibacter sp. TMW2.1885]MCL1512717.1 4-hydroxy-tetrahydrodipicolinate reductase [Parasaccharibacter sp. TMW 2.1891]MCT6819727.1 4-hydroxy-tetrahydrodipicolinate reductase [Bombella apis]MCT6845228.1 4-hydroxy-tetrahydrodipicolinate reductase [Bombella apis]UPO79838.1 4-hydroxy-tetrahydrodipicolinate reductase [Parasaccharibacter sp. TMW 2.1888]
MSNTSPSIGIAGITGRLGHLCAEEAGALLAGGLSRTADPARNIVSSASELASRCDVIIDVSHASLVPAHAKAFAAAGCAWVLGTTGLDGAAQQAVHEAAGQVAVLQAANFSPALTMLLSLARQLGAALPDYDAEILEVHHRQKLDAPSGTALAIGRAVAAGRDDDFEAVRRLDQNGKRPDGAIGFASLRGGQVVGEHDLRFFAADEEISLSHRALDRRVFARGALKAALWLADPRRTPGLYGMQDVLNTP